MKLPGAKSVLKLTPEFRGLIGYIPQTPVISWRKISFFRSASFLISTRSGYNACESIPIFIYFIGGCHFDSSEISYDIAHIASAIRQRSRHGTNFSIVAVAEGAIPGRMQRHSRRPRSKSGARRPKRSASGPRRNLRC